MDKIKKIERLLKEWKSDIVMIDGAIIGINKERKAGIVMGIEMTLEILKKEEI